MSASPRLPPPLLALTPGDLDASRAPQLVERVARCIEAGLRGVLLRERGLADRDFLTLALALRARLSACDGWLCLHDRPHLALACGADAVHLGGSSLAPRDVRRWLAPEIALGLSTHAHDARESWSDADYLVHGPVKPTSKSGTRVEGIGFEALASAVRSTPIPIWALGGLTPSDSSAVARTNARGIAVLSGLLAAPDPALRTREFVAAWSAVAPPQGRTGSS